MRFRKTISISVLCVLLATCGYVRASDYDQDLKAPMELVNKATWLTKGEYEKFYKAFDVYLKDRKYCFAGLIAVIRKPDKDIKSDWDTARFIGASALEVLTAAITKPKIARLGLTEFFQREELMYRKLKAEKFLAGRSALIAMTAASIDSAKKFEDALKDLDSKMNEDNVLEIEKVEKVWEKVNAAGERIEFFSKALAFILAGSGEWKDVFEAGDKAGEVTKTVAPWLGEWHKQALVKRQLWEQLKKYEELHDRIWDQINFKAIETKFREAELESADSADHKQFNADAMADLTKIMEIAKRADEDFVKVIKGRLKERTDDVLEAMSKREKLLKRFSEIENVEQKNIEMLNKIKESCEKLRDGDEKKKVVTYFQEEFEMWRSVSDEQKRDIKEFLDSYQELLKK
jgi:hypothetical protein